MFQSFFTELRAAKIPVTIREYLTLIEGVDKGVAHDSLDGFYYLSRTALVKDERDLDKFDQIFSHVFRGVDYLNDIFGAMKAAVKISARQARLLLVLTAITPKAYALDKPKAAIRRPPRFGISVTLKT